ncbi:MAG: nucleotidyltransferase domain-containing protein [Lachnospiraceae bacterium]|nr:nucleotidyltransferase domain-containing protein [Lachnospiraceae bacterium]
MCTRNQLNDISGQMVSIYRDIYGDAVAGVFLYGSYARGDFEKDSDVDIVAIVKGERLALQDKLRTIWDLSADIGLEHDTVVSPTVIPYDEFEEYKEVLPYYRNIAREGLRIG